MKDDSVYDVSIVLPCYQEETSIENSLEEINETINKLPFRVEVLFVDDASTDKTREKILEASKKYSYVRYIFLEKNTGRGQAFIIGAKAAKGRIIGFLDVDLEISIHALPDVISAIESGSDVCIVKRNYKIEWNPEFILRHLASITYKRLVWSVLKLPRLDTESGFKFFKREKLFELLDKIESPGWFFDTEIMCVACYSKMHVAQVDGIYKKNWNKRSTVNLFSDSLRQFFSVLSYRKKLKKIFPE